MFERTQEDSLTDALTALPNTRSMFMHLTKELARADRMKSEVSKGSLLGKKRAAQQKGKGQGLHN